MIVKPDWHSKFRQELEQAERARQAGNEGMARVCARRAAAILVRKFYSRHRKETAHRSGIAAVRSLASDPEVSEEVRRVASHFLLTINFEHDLPPGVDLLADALALERALFGDVGTNENRAATSRPE